ncbi:helix-turn-helix transcriptional regulator [Synechococcus sp. WH 8020]|nr:AlpA family phage regulatory protein [Synechococcus sp. WH 8020]
MYRSIAAWEFPKQVPIGGNTVVWTESSVYEWMSDRIKEA